MITVTHTNIYKIGEYSTHLKNLSESDTISRFGYNARPHSIDQLILNMCYNPTDHELWYATMDDTDARVGWGHMAKNSDGTWELAVSVEAEHQRKGIGNKLMQEMLTWAKFYQVQEVYMHCIEENKVIQHLADKHELKKKEYGDGERTVTINIPKPNLVETNMHLWKEHTEILHEFARLRKRYKTLWSTAIAPKLPKILT